MRLKSRSRALKRIQTIVRDAFNGEERIFVPGRSTIPLMEPPISWQEINEVMDSIMRNEFTIGRKVVRFEKEYARYFGTEDAIMTNSGSSANLIALSTLANPRKKDPIKPGDEIICPAIGWATTYFPIVNIGAIPVFVDIDLGTYTMNAEQTEEAVTERTAAIMPVHLAGNVAMMDRLTEIKKRYGLYLVEDTCEAHGADYKGMLAGTIGDIGTFSFYMSHHITTVEGGMMVTNDYEISEIARSLRAFGWIRDMKSKDKIAEKFSELDERFIFYNLGFNLRPTEIDASFGLQQLKKLDANIKARRVNAKYWLSKLKTVDDLFILPETTMGGNHVWFGFPITVKEDAPFTKKEIVAYMEKKKIETRPLMSGNMVEHPSANLYKHRTINSLPNARLVTKNGFFFGNYPQMLKEEREYIVKTIEEFVALKVRR